MSQIITLRDGPLQRRIEIDSDGKARSQLQQPGRAQILARNAELRKNPGAIRNGEAFGLEYNVPLADYHTIMKHIKRNNPGISPGEAQKVFAKLLAKGGQCYKVRG